MIQNGGFEEAGSTSAVPAGWTASFVSSLEEVADFDRNAADPTASQESFEGGWAPDPQLLIAAFQGNTIDLETPVFNFGDIQGPIEGFERGWHAPVLTLIATLPGAESASFDTGTPEAVEDFEEEWGTFDLALPSTATAMFDSTPEAFEDFGEGWGNDAYLVAYPAMSPPLTAAIFDTAESVEDFEEVRGPERFQVNAATDQIQFRTAFAPDQDDGMRFSTDDDGELPTGLSPTATYYVIDTVTYNGSTQLYSFLVSAVKGGGGVSLSDAGSGNLYLHRDPAKWWSALLSTV